MKGWWLLDSLLESMGLLCLAIKNSHGSDVGRTKLQKMIYFADRYMGWDVGDYRLHYYGPYSRNISSTLEIVRESLIEETPSLIEVPTNTPSPRRESSFLTTLPGTCVIRARSGAPRDCLANCPSVAANGWRLRRRLTMSKEAIRIWAQMSC